MSRIDEDELFEEALRGIKELDLDQIAALMLGLDPKSPTDREWVKAVLADDRETPTDCLPEPSKPTDREATWRVYRVLQTLQLADRLSQSRLAAWRGMSEQGKLAKQNENEYLGPKGAEHLERDLALLAAYQEDIKDNGRRGAPVRLAERFGMTPRNCRNRLKKIQDYQPVLEQREKVRKKWAEIRKFKKSFS